MEEVPMRKHIVLAATAALLVAPGVADAKPRFKTITSTGIVKGHLAQPATTEGYAFAGFLSDSKLGEGATTSQGSFSGATTTGGLIAFFDHGTLRGSFSFTAAPQPDGSVALAGTTKYQGGTGRYRGAKGSGRVTGTQDADGYTTFEYSQTLRVRRR
jgi:hypothetical protein